MDLNKRPSTQLAEELAKAKTPEEKEQILAKALKALTDTEGNLDTAQNFIDEQAIQLEKQRKADKNYRPEVTLTINKKPVTVSIVHGVDGLSKDELANDLKKVAKLLENESSAVELVTE